MLPISSRSDMNSRETRQRSHKSRIGSREAVSDRDGMIEAADQGKQGRISHRLIPVIEDDAERWLAPHEADDGAEDDGHPQQRGKASAEADAAERGENNQDARFAGKSERAPGSISILAADSGAAPKLETPTSVRSRLSRNCRSRPARRAGLRRAARWERSAWLAGAVMRWASTNALRIASARSAWRASIDRSSQSGSSRSRDSAQYHSPSS